VTPPELRFAVLPPTDLTRQETPTLRVRGKNGAEMVRYREVSKSRRRAIWELDGRTHHSRLTTANPHRRQAAPEKRRHRLRRGQLPQRKISARGADRRQERSAWSWVNGQPQYSLGGRFDLRLSRGTPSHCRTR
jgi:hypothetical protein